ncbi:SGS-domain-containing protein [Thozetella sp. PMI_491]|nr:SGS-domain-containing protein [Thozetella sp. PMI_491]
MADVTAGQRGLEAVRNKQYAAAIPLLDKALESSSSPTWLLARAQAHQMLKNYDLALQDCELAYHTAAERGSGNSRKLMIDAQYRRATIFFKMGRYADSDCCAKWSMLLAEGRPAREQDGVEKKVDENGFYTVTSTEAIADKEGQPGGSGGNSLAAMASLSSASEKKDTGYTADWNRAYAWRSQALGALERLPADAPGRKVTVQKFPPRREQRKTNAVVVEEDSDLEETAAPAAKPAPPQRSDGPVPEERLKLRADFYQSTQAVTISLFVKDAKKDLLKVELGPKEVTIGPIPRDAAPYLGPEDRESYSTIQLPEDINPSTSRYSVTPRKIELVLQKLTPGTKWATWGKEVIGRSAEPSSSEKTTVAAPTTDAPAAAKPSTSTKTAPSAAAAPAYPTSSKSGPKNWDKLGDAEEDDEAKEDVNYFFKKLYSGASPEQQRAMMKSFTESNGTSLSTDWNDVKDRTVKTLPPDGVEEKKW